MSRKATDKNLKVALVDDYMTVEGGAQRVLRIYKEMWPQAVVYTPEYFPENFDPPLKDWDIRTSFVSKFPFRKTFEQQYKLFYPMAVERFDLSEYDFVLSMTAAGYAKAVITPPDALHVCYVNTVPRYLWGYRTSRHERVNWLYKHIILPPLEHYWRIWDRQTAQRPDVLVSNSANIARRVKKHWDRDSEVIHPPCQIDGYLKQEMKSGDYFVYFGRLEKYKCVEMAIEACAKASQKLKIIGTGSYEQELREKVNELGANELVEFLGWMTSEKMEEIVAGAKAFIFPGPDEDFGMVMVESLAAGTPVIAFDAGGAAEIVEDGKTGMLVNEFSQEKLNKAVKEFDPEAIKSELCRESSKKFSVEEFKKKLINLVNEHL